MQRLAHQMGDSYRQTIESDKIHVIAQKKAISSRIVNQVMSILQKFGSVSNVIETEQLQPKEDVETGAISYDGEVLITATVIDREGTKRVKLPVKVVASEEVIEQEAINKAIETTPCSEIVDTPITPTVDVSLRDFELTDDGSEFVKVSHKAIGKDIGVIEKSALKVISIDEDAEAKKYVLEVAGIKETDPEFARYVEKRKEQIQKEKLGLESMLKQATLDETKDWNATINFTGTFVKPFIKSAKEDEPKKSKGKETSEIDAVELFNNIHTFVNDFVTNHATDLKGRTEKEVSEFIRAYPGIKDTLTEGHLKSIIEDVYKQLNSKSDISESNTDMPSLPEMSDVPQSMPELPPTEGTNIPPTPESEIAKVAALNDLTSKFKQADSYNQYTEREKFVLGQKKQKLETEAANNLVRNLISLGYNSVKVLTSEASLNENMLGDIIVKAKFYDNGIDKIADFVSSSEGTFDEAKVKESITAATVDNTIEKQIENEVNTKIAAIDNYENWHAKTTEAAMKEKDEIIPTGDAPSSTPQMNQVHPILHINKSVLPESIKVGDIYPISGLQYRVTSLSAGQLSKEKDSGSLVTLELIKE